MRQFVTRMQPHRVPAVALDQFLRLSDPIITILNRKAVTWWPFMGSCLVGPGIVKRVTRASDSICDENLPLRVGLCNAPSEPHSGISMNPCRHANKVLMEHFRPVIKGTVPFSEVTLTPENPHSSFTVDLRIPKPDPTPGVRPGYHRGRSEQRSRIKAESLALLGRSLRTHGGLGDHELHRQ